MYLYIVTCQDGSYYTGIAKDIRVRLQAHYDRKSNVQSTPRAILL